MNTMFIINAFPRSGNTYLRQLFEEVFKKNKIYDLTIHSHMHNPSLKFKKDNNNILIVRKPEDALSSLIYMYKDPGIHNNYLKNTVHVEKGPGFYDKVLDAEIRRYIMFLNAYRPNQNKCVIFFEYLTEVEPNMLFEEIFKYFYVDTSRLKNKIDDKDLAKIKSDNDKFRKNNIYTLNYPRKVDEREDYKEIKNYLINYKGFEQAKNAYEQFLKRVHPIDVIGYIPQNGSIK